jgi:membrane fusion protein, multidrug efflux system
MQDHPIAAVFTVPQEQLPEIAKALKNGPVNVVALSSDGTHPLDTGTLVAPNNQVDQSTGTIQLKAEFSNKDNALWPGQFIDARVQVATAHDAVSIPQAAVQNGPDGQYVFIVKADNTVALQPITIGYQTPQIAVVTKGLSGDETLVTEGALRLQPGSRVTVGDGERVARS